MNNPFEINGDAVMVFIPNGGTRLADTTHSVANAGAIKLGADTTVSFDTVLFTAPLPMSKGDCIGVPEGAANVTLGTSSVIALMNR